MKTPADLEITYLPDDPQVVDTVSAWLWEAFGKRQPDGDPKQIHAETAERIKRADLPLCLVAWLDGQPAGTASVINDDMRSRPDLNPWFADMYVPPPFRNRGIGTALTDRVIVEARRLGFPVLYLFTWDHEARYARQGWTLINREQYRQDLVSVMKFDL